LRHVIPLGRKLSFSPDIGPGPVKHEKEKNRNQPKDTESPFKLAVLHQGLSILL
jgi:hypothetical protein